MLERALNLQVHLNSLLMRYFKWRQANEGRVMNTAEYELGDTLSEVVKLETLKELTIKPELFSEDVLLKYIRQAEIAFVTGSAHLEDYEVFVLCQAELAKRARGQ